MTRSLVCKTVARMATHAEGKVRSLATGAPEKACDQTKLPYRIPDEAFLPRKLSAGAEGALGVAQDMVKAALQAGQQTAGPFWSDELLQGHLRRSAVPVELQLGQLEMCIALQRPQTSPEFTLGVCSRTADRRLLYRSLLTVVRSAGVNRKSCTRYLCRARHSMSRRAGALSAQAHCGQMSYLSMFDTAWYVIFVSAQGSKVSTLPCRDRRHHTQALHRAEGGEGGHKTVSAPSCRRVFALNFTRAGRL